MTSECSGNDWGDYYRAVQGRAPRALLLEALARIEADRVAPTGAQAVDLGCGDGTETALLLEAGWRVLALDQQPEAVALVRGRIAPEHADRLETQVVPFHQADLPPAFLVFAGLSLPFCPLAYFGAVWARVTAAILPGGYFVGHLFGDRDSWVGRSGMTFHTRSEAEALFSGFEFKTFREIDEVRPTALEGPKRKHAYEIIAQKSGAAAEP